MLEYIGCFGPKTTRFLIVMMNLRREMCSFGGVVVGDARPIQLNHQHLWHCQGLPLSGPLGRHLGNLEVKPGHRNPTCLMLLWNPGSRQKKNCLSKVVEKGKKFGSNEAMNWAWCLMLTWNLSASQQQAGSSGTPRKIWHVDTTK